MQYCPMRTLLLISIACSALTWWPAHALTPGDEQAAKYIRQRAIQHLDSIRDGISEAQSLREPERTRRLDALMDEVVAPLIGAPEALQGFYGEHWEEVQRLKLEDDALKAVTTMMRDNYLYILERSLKKKIKVQRVTVRGQNAEILIRVFLRKTVPLEFELRRYGNTQWTVYDAVFLGTSIRDGMKRQLREDIEESGVEGAIREILTLRGDSGSASSEESP